MSSLEELRNIRKDKLNKLEKSGFDPYPSNVPRTFCLKDAKENFDDYLKHDKTVSLAGRVMAIRGQGAIFFVVLYDGKGKFQAVLKKDKTEENYFNLFTETVDIGDFISVTGKYFVTERGEKSILVSNWLMASKSLLPLPEKWHGIKDDDERYRKRYLDLLMNEELMNLMMLKSKFWNVIRSYFNEKGFIEVETPTLEVTTGGAEATPFKTHHNDYDLDVYMRISVGELWQKRLMAAGFPKTFEIGRVYRNEGSSPEHLQEFTNLEFYWSFADFKDGMKLVRDLYIKIAEDVFGKTKFETRGFSFDLKDEWTEIDYVDEIKKQTSIDVEKDPDAKIMDKLRELGVKYEGANRERLVDTIWKYCRKNIAGPAFLVNHPTLISPLAKKIPGTNKAQMFQPIIAGSELGRGYSEINNPEYQLERFNEQKKMGEEGDTEAMMQDEDFIEMLEHGMPPTCGFGFGERLFAFLADKPIREMQLFPLMRPKK